MPTLSITKTYDDGQILTEAMLDNIKSGIETFVNTTKLDSDNIQDGGLDADTLASSAVTAAKLAADAVTTVKIADLQVTTAKIAANAVTGAKLNSDTVDNSTLQYTSSQLSIKDSGVTTAKLNDGAVTQAKRASLGQQISSSSGNASSGSAGDCTNMSVSITTTGRPVHIVVIPDGTANTSAVLCDAFKFDRSGTLVAQFYAGSTSHPPGSLHHIDVPAAGTYTYKLAGLASWTVQYCKLAVYEL